MAALSESREIYFSQETKGVDKPFSDIPAQSSLPMDFTSANTLECVPTFEPPSLQLYMYSGISKIPSPFQILQGNSHPFPNRNC